MEVRFLPDAKKDLQFWKDSHNTKIQEKIQSLLNSIKDTPFAGLGKPEPLKNEQSGRWSRRITQEHRLVYEVEEGKIFVYSLRGHYQ